jgi:hypothetical protein
MFIPEVSNSGEHTPEQPFTPEILHGTGFSALQVLFDNYWGSPLMNSTGELATVIQRSIWRLVAPLVTTTLPLPSQTLGNERVTY